MSCGSRTAVQKFYQDCGVFVTGGTGFLGKLIIEKILRVCPDVGKVYVLIRPKKNLSVEERKNAMFNNVVFDRLKSEQPQFLEKIAIVSGDCMVPRLGLSHSDYHDLTQHANIVLHLAATVRFDEKMKVAINVNIKGAMEVINLCKECVSLKAAVFVTTAFSNPFPPRVKEEFYDPPMQFEEVVALMDRVTEQELEILSHKVTGPWKIPYLFSKAVVEKMILTHAKGLPVSIVRPSMVVGTASEPIPGWVDNMYGPIAIIAGAATGVLRVNYADPDLILDLVPADIVTNCIICVAATMSTRSTDAIDIYNVATSDNNPVTVRTITESFLEYRETFPLNRCLWYPFLMSFANFKIYTILALFLHVLPGSLVDVALRLKGKQPILMKMYRKIRKYAIIINMFPMQSLIFITNNTRNLYEKLEHKDQELFLFDTRRLSVAKLMETAILESRKYVLNETLDNLQNARSKIRRLRIIHNALKYFLYGLAVWAAWKLMSHYMLGMF